MSTNALKVRSNGQRRTLRPKVADLIGPSIGLSTSGRPGEHRLNYSQIHAIEHLYNTHPAIQASRTILHGQLLSGSLVLRRSGKNVELKPAFKTHLDESWIPFAADVIDSFLKFGYCVVSYEQDESSLVNQSIKRRRKTRNDVEETRNLIPIVPPTDTYEVAYVMGGRMGYQRRYCVYSMAPNNATKIDEDARIVVRQNPDPTGNINSPMATIFDLGSFVSALTELAMTAEITNARPRIWTQMRKENKTAGLDPQALFYDSESRGVQASREGEESQLQAQNLAMQQQLMKVINRMQTTFSSTDNQPNSFSGGGGPQKHSHVPPEVAPSLFCLPKEHEMAPAAGQLPQARGDLEALSRLAIEQFGAAFGVPADLMFQGRFASKSTAQLSLLNTTVSQLAKYVSTVLTMAYRDIYGEDDSLEEPAQLELLTAPLAATDEVINLYAAGLAPVEIAMPACLHAIGASQDQIDAALEKATEEAEKKCACEDEDRVAQKKEADLAVREREQNLKNGNESAKVQLESQKFDLAERKKAAANGNPPDSTKATSGAKGPK